MNMAVKKKKTSKKSAKDQIIDAALKRAATHGWRNLTMVELSADTGLSLNQIHAVYRNKAQILQGYVHRLDHSVVDGYEADESDTTRDRLFDLMMSRFDGMNDHKEAVKEIINQAANEPDTLITGGYGLLCSMRRMLRAASVSVDGCHGMMKVQALGLIFACTSRTWLDDESDDMSRTMAKLDKYLAQAERFEQGLCGLRNRVMA